MKRVFESGKTYELNDSWKSYYDEQEDENGELHTGYHYAQIAFDPKGASIYVADCWIVNQKGERHPGFSETPVPVNIDQVK